VTTTYPQNCWYVAATSDEVGDDLISRRLLDRSIVLRRLGSGEVVALEDRCAHRGFPLSAGHVDGDLIVCGYHGFSFDGNGACVRVPSQPNVPYGARVWAFPVREEPPFVWVWPGEPRRAALQAPPRLPWLTGPGWDSSGVRVDVNANYLLIHDHYLDLTHVPVMHPEMLAPALHALPSLDQVSVSEMSVSLSRTLPPAPLAPWEAEVTGLPAERDYRRRHHGSFLSPAVVIEGWTIDGGEGASCEQVRVQAVTPLSDTTTRMFWRVARNYGLDRPDSGRRLHALLEALMRKDMEVVESIQANPAARPWAAVRVSADVAMLKSRAIVAAMLTREKAVAPPSVQPRGEASRGR
jgi:vanillate O-demethylase monooxygenase subunit